MALVPFATSTELAAFWRVLTATEIARADILLPLASNFLRVKAEKVGIDLDTQSTDSEAFASTLQWVVMEAAKRAISTPTDTPPVETYGQTAGPYSENYKFTNPSGDLWFKKSELEAIGLKGRQTMSAIETSITDIYTADEDAEVIE